MPVTLYKRQKQILDFINHYVSVNVHCWTLQEIVDALSLRSLATVHEHLQALSRKGIIRRFEGSVRGIEVLDKKIGDSLQGIELPLLGFIAAGAPIEPYTDPNATFSVSPALVSAKKRSYVLQVKGDSMIEDGILDGDFVVIEEQNVANNGDIIVALLENGVATLKRFFKEKDRIRLQPANSAMKPIYAKKVTVQGKVVGVIRKF